MTSKNAFCPHRKNKCALSRPHFLVNQKNPEVEKVQKWKEVVQSLKSQCLVEWKILPYVELGLIFLLGHRSCFSSRHCQMFADNKSLMNSSLTSFTTVLFSCNSYEDAIFATFYSPLFLRAAGILWQVDDKQTFCFSFWYTVCLEFLGFPHIWLHLKATHRYWLMQTFLSNIICWVFRCNIHPRSLQRFFANDSILFQAFREFGFIDSLSGQSIGYIIVKVD